MPRKSGLYRGTYIGFNLNLTSEVQSYRDVVCEHFHLVPRRELHLTLGYLGTIDRAALEGVRQFMRGAKHILPPSITLELSGIGAASHSPSGATIPLDNNNSEHLLRPRLAWWMVTPSPLIGKLRERFLKAVERYSLEAGRLEEAWTPHITLGSADPGDSMGPVSRWDVHGMFHVSTAVSVPHPLQVEVKQLHITNGRRQPESLAVVWFCRRQVAS